MKRKYWVFAIAVLLAAGGLWYARLDRTDALEKSNIGNADERTKRVKFDSSGTAPLSEDSRTDSIPDANNIPERARTLRPPNQSQIFADFTPEERVQFARKGHGPGG